MASENLGSRPLCNIELVIEVMNEAVVLADDGTKRLGLR